VATRVGTVNDPAQGGAAPAPGFWRDKDDALLAPARRLAALLERCRTLLAMGDAQGALWTLREAHEEIQGLCDLAFGG
jgi:hypothetical protein